MMEMVTVVVLVSSLAFLLLAAGCALHRLCAGYWPARFYALCFAWWRTGKDSALTIASALLDADEDCTEWSRGPGYGSGWVHRETNMEITLDFEGCVSGLRVVRERADIDSWGWYSLIKSFSAWQRRKRHITASEVNRKAAEAVQRAYGAS